MLQAVPTLFTNSSTTVLTGRRRVVAITVSETGSSTGIVALGTGSVTGDVLYRVNLTSLSNANFTPQFALLFSSGIYVIAATDTGAYSGTIWTV
jgi:hypothetical protein